jgi:Fe-S oxidoreductase/coenzyme F420-reducing hydrogenase delta subunit
MDKKKIVLFMCNWGPHAAFQTLQESSSPIPPEIRMVRIPCSGRISKSLLFRAFEMGADGVALVGCTAGSCRYGSGTPSGLRNVEDTRGILEMLGLGKERLQWSTFLPDESESLLAFLLEFKNHIEELGKSPVTPPHSRRRDHSPEHKNVAGQAGLTPSACGSISAEVATRLLAAHDVYTCQDCGKCSSACPLALIGKPFSPRAVANSVISGAIDAPTVVRDTWSCLTCGTCYDRCPSAVTFPEFIRGLREIQREGGFEGHQAHDGFFQSLMRTMTSPDLAIKHWNWLPEHIRLDSSSKLLFFGGCAPYFDAFFRHHLDVQTSTILVDSLRLLNFFDIHPNILEGERCCGHDLLWSGDRDNFLKLATLNVEAIEKLGIEEVVTACPECYRTLSRDYPEHGVNISFKVTHLYELLEKEIDKGAVGFDRLDRKLTFQDSCRLNRLGDGTDLPRKLLNRLKPRSYSEMQDHGMASICCGNCAWTGCDSYSKALQVKRLRQAKATGSDLLVTACPKCQIHLNCAMEDPFDGDEIQMEMMDLASVLARTIRWE